MQTKLVLSGKEINLTSDNTIIKSNNFNVDKNGNMSCSNANITNGNVKLTDALGTGGNLEIKSGTNFKNSIRSYGQTIKGPYGVVKLEADFAVAGGYIFVGPTESSSNSTTIQDGNVKCVKLTQTSLAEQKKNFEKLEDNAIETIKNIDIYKYNLKSEEDTDKKHIGFVIGDGYNYSKEVTSIDNTGVDNYSFTSLCCKAIQEQQKLIEELQKEIQRLKEDK